MNSATALSLTQKCSIDYKGGISAVPVVIGAIAYYPTWSGLYVALDYQTCQPVWEFNVTSYVLQYPTTFLQTNYTHAVSRTSATVDGNILYFGTQMHAMLVALNRTTGTLIADLQLNIYPYAVVTTSPTVYNGMVFVGCSSQEETVASDLAGYKCCSFIGNMVGAKLVTTSSQFHVMWNVSMLPEEPAGWSGGAVWGSQPSIDVSRNQVFIAVGNVYTTPPEFEACQNQTQNISVVAQGLVPDPCIPSNVYQESVIAFDMDTGFINWVTHLSPLDSWIIACGTSGSVQNPNVKKDPALWSVLSSLYIAEIVILTAPHSPHTPGVDADFGMMPTFIPGSPSTPQGADTLVLGQKNGNLYALSAQAGTVFWATSTSPDGNIGGLTWGVAVDDYSVYFTAVNSDLVSWTPQGSNMSIMNSAFGAVDLLTGKIKWETPSPMGALSLAVPTVVNDVVFFSRAGNSNVTDYDMTPGGLIPVDKYSGEILKDYGLETNMHGGVAVVDGYVMFGTGYGGNLTGQFLVWSV